MIPIPAIDLKEGRVVRLLHGNFKEEKIYPVKPEEVAQGYQEQGAERVHVVDLDGALRGKPANLDLVEKILKHVKIPLEVGGGIRDLKSVAEYLQMGVRWVILGTKACLDRGFMQEAVKEFGGSVIVGMDALGGMIATDGWTRITTTRAIDLAVEYQKAGGQALIYTDISKDGALQGPNLKEISLMCQATSLEIIASGGVGSLKDLKNLMELKKANLKGVIIGKALYENNFTLSEALKTCLPNA